MKLVAEQVKYLRDQRKKLIQKQKEYQDYISSRERTSFEEFGCPMVGDFSDDMNVSRSLAEVGKIDSLLRNGEIVWDRNFDEIDIGTGFFIQSMGRHHKLRRFVLTDSYSPSLFLQTVSIDSDLGKNVRGKKTGDVIRYRVDKTGRVVTATIEAIDTDKGHYEHFLKEDSISKRMCQGAREELHYLKGNDLTGYQSRHQLTDSQRELIMEELFKIPSGSNHYSDVRRRSYFQRLLNSEVAATPTDDSIGIGSLVTVQLEDENGDIEKKSFEVINQAVSTELVSDYVERISPLGHTLFGLKPTDEFFIRRNHLPRLRGVVEAVENEKKLVK